MKLPRIKKKFVAVGLATGLAMGAAGIAAAFFTATGTGTSTTKVGSPTSWTVHVTTATGPTLYPGEPGDTFAYTVKNVGTGVQKLNATTVSVTLTATATTRGCSPVTFTVFNLGPTLGTMNPGASVNGTVFVTLINEPYTQDGCRTAVVTVHVTAS